jgi:DNA-directed RNA polymerase subunit M/transcription elongation factor TFIIS
MVFFCPHCGNMLLVEKSRAGDTWFYCQTCPYICPIDRNISELQTAVKKKKKDDIFKDEMESAPIVQGMFIREISKRPLFLNRFCLFCRCYL